MPAARPFTGQEYLESLRDGREVWIYGERVEDVTVHPAFRNSARTIARLYDALHDPAHRAVLTTPTDTPDGTFTHPFFRAPATVADLRAAREAVTAWQRMTYGWMGRTPDYKASFLATLGADPDLYGPFADNALAWYRHAQDRMPFLGHALTGPPTGRHESAERAAEVCVRVEDETDAGIVVSGAKGVATGSALCHHVFIGHGGPPLTDPAQATTFIAAMDTPGLRFICRASYERQAALAGSPFDYPLSSRFDENDAVAVFDRALIPWSDVRTTPEPSSASSWAALTGCPSLPSDPPPSGNGRRPAGPAGSPGRIRRGPPRSTAGRSRRSTRGRRARRGAAPPPACSGTGGARSGSPDRRRRRGRPAGPQVAGGQHLSAEEVLVLRVRAGQRHALVVGREDAAQVHAEHRSAQHGEDQRLERGEDDREQDRDHGVVQRDEGTFEDRVTNRPAGEGQTGGDQQAECLEGEQREEQLGLVPGREPPQPPGPERLFGGPGEEDGVGGRVVALAVRVCVVPVVVVDPPAVAHPDDEVAQQDARQVGRPPAGEHRTVRDVVAEQRQLAEHQGEQGREGQLPPAGAEHGEPGQERRQRGEQRHAPAGVVQRPPAQQAGGRDPAVQLGEVAVPGGAGGRGALNGHPTLPVSGRSGRSWRSRRGLGPGPQRPVPEPPLSRNRSVSSAQMAGSGGKLLPPSVTGPKVGRVFGIRSGRLPPGWTALTSADPFSTLSGMSLIRAACLQGYPELVAELGSDHAELLRPVGIAPGQVGRAEVYLRYRDVAVALESAARATGAADFGRRLALRQGLEILGPIAAAARTAPTVGEAYASIHRYLSVYSPALAVSVEAGPAERYARFEYRTVGARLPQQRQAVELALGVALRLSRLVVGEDFTAVSAHVPHRALTDAAEYDAYFGCPTLFEQPFAGFRLRRGDLERQVSSDSAVHEIVHRYLDAICPTDDGTVATPVRALIRRLLPTGGLGLDLVAAQLATHPRTLQRRLTAEGASFADLVDEARRDEAERLLRDTRMPMGQVARSLGHTAQSILSRSSRRWFGMTATEFRAALQAD